MFELFFLCSLLAVGFSQLLPAGPEPNGDSERPLKASDNPEKSTASRHRSHPRTNDGRRVDVHRHPGGKEPRSALQTAGDMIHG
ncbi:hypothetical protein [Geothermobacter hydrogeniphilus]|uniref:hypothetical protein n=1 Tax=Geothermobacter hydrogeniphilus TaxID=1969733 RepID=UPI0011AFCC60|nr:hypothetical protein [Geothermobacter hydrogeniphilus]